MSDIADAKSASTATFVTALVFNAVVFGAELAVFTLIRPYFKSIYEPRTYVPKPSKRIKPLSSNIFFWPLAVFRADYRAIISANGLDAYFYVRFLRVMAIVFLPIWFISWIVLLPLTSVNTSVPGLTGLSRFTFGNVSPDKQDRYAGHLILVYFFTFWIFYNIKREMHHFIITRQQHLIERTHVKSVQAKTILITGIPKKYLTQHALFKLFNELPGGVEKIWINRNLKELPDIYDRRTAACNKLEAAETDLLRTAAKLRLEAAKLSSKTQSQSKEKEKEKDKKIDRATLPSDEGHGAGAGAEERQAQAEGDLESALALAEISVPESARPTHRLGMIPFVGERVDTIRWARGEIEECTRLLEEGRAKIRESDAAMGHDGEGEGEGDRERGVLLSGAAVDENGEPILRVDRQGQGQSQRVLNPVLVGKQAVGVVGEMTKGAVGGVAKGAGVIKDRVTGGGGGEEGEYPPLNSAFVTFRRQVAAHLAVQVLAHHEPYRMSSRYIEVAPADVIWSNLGMNPYEQKIRIAISWAATAALILLWAIPVAFVGIISNVHTLCTTAKFLAWICTLPDVVVGIISGILPPVMLAILMMLLPIVLRLLARFEGIPKYTGLELSLMTRFFVFEVLHSFLIVTLSSGIIASLNELTHNPTSIPTILAQNLPQASTFFLTYIILQGLSVVAGGFLQIVPLVIYYVKLFVLGSTPRSVWSIKYGLGSVAWGTLFPDTTLLVVIALGYSIISPIINGLACATFFMFYQLYKYLFLYAYQQPSSADTGGLFYPKALQHVFVGLYVEQVCLCALFFLARDEKGRVSALPEGALMVVLIVITAGFHVIINNSYGPLLTALPLSLQNRMMTAPVIEPQPTDVQAQGEGEITEEAKPKRSSSPDSGSDVGLGHSEPASASALGLGLGLGLEGTGAYAKKGQEEDTEEEEEKEEENADVYTDKAEREEESYGFAHPAASRPQRTVWIPRDVGGMWVEEERECREAGVRVSVRRAGMDKKGKVDVRGGPPDLVV